MEDKTVWRQKLYLLLGEDYCRYIDPMKSIRKYLKVCNMSHDLNAYHMVNNLVIQDILQSLLLLLCVTVLISSTAG